MPHVGFLILLLFHHVLSHPEKCERNIQCHKYFSIIRSKAKLTPLPEASHVIMSKPSWEMLLVIIDAASLEEHLVGGPSGTLKIAPSSLSLAEAFKICR
mmetsp:Transcript_19496/g.41737  ORF Transcript_19496/g.41737 Transcript_19496/m.41737 type:complete len:99 (+) Transcript_19496:882-1178(+)